MLILQDTVAGDRASQLVWAAHGSVALEFLTYRQIESSKQVDRLRKRMDILENIEIEISESRAGRDGHDDQYDQSLHFRICKQFNSPPAVQKGLSTA